ncbi:MAG: NlpC/P60 family protein, partial [Mycobacteriales bacterium]
MRGASDAGGGVIGVGWHPCLQGVRRPERLIWKSGTSAGSVLMFFEPRTDGPSHVGIYIGEGQLIEAPHSGDVVRLAPLAQLTAALGFVGATRPSRLPQPTTTTSQERASDRLSVREVALIKFLRAGGLS